MMPSTWRPRSAMSRWTEHAHIEQDKTSVSVAVCRALRLGRAPAAAQCGGVRGRRCASAFLTSSREAHICIRLNVHLEVELIADLEESEMCAGMCEAANGEPVTLRKKSARRAESTALSPVRECMRDCLCLDPGIVEREDSLDENDLRALEGVELLESLVRLERIARHLDALARAQLLQRVDE